MAYILKTTHLTKTYSGKEIVSGVTMSVEQGKIYGFLGPNGAGKTTVMKMITNLIKPTSGEVELFGEKLTNHSYHLLARIGSIIEYPIFYEKLSARDNLDLHCEYMGYHDKKSIDETLELVGLAGTQGKAVKDFSLGMKQRLGIARAMITKPDLLILDEPTNGLDPVGIKEFRDLFHRLSREYGTTLLISSHILGEIELMADTIAVINNGRLIEEVAMEQIRNQQTEYLELSTEDVTKAAFVLEHEMGIKNIRVIDQKLIRIYDNRIPQNTMTKTLVMKDVPIDSLQKKNISLEDYFLNLIHEGERDA